jgi:hypothetical protein
MHHLLHFHVFIHLHSASHLGTLDEPRGGHDVELNPKMVFGGSIPKMEGAWSACMGRDVPQDGAG